MMIPGFHVIFIFNWIDAGTLATQVKVATYRYGDVVVVFSTQKDILTSIYKSLTS